MYGGPSGPWRQKLARPTSFRRAMASELDGGRIRNAGSTYLKDVREPSRQHISLHFPDLYLLHSAFPLLKRTVIPIADRKKGQNPVYTVCCLHHLVTCLSIITAREVKASWEVTASCRPYTITRESQGRSGNKVKLWTVVTPRCFRKTASV